MPSDPVLPGDQIMADFERAEKKIDPIPIYWEKIAERPAKEICKNSGANEIGPDALSIKFTEKEVIIRTKHKSMKESDGRNIDDMQTKMVLLLYLQSKGTEYSSEAKDHTWVSPLQLPNGEAFFRGPHTIPTKVLEEHYGDDPEGFLEAGRRIGGKEASRGDASFYLRVLPNIYVYFVLFVEDEEFPARVNMMFGESINEYLPLDGIWALSNILVRRLLE